MTKMGIVFKYIGCLIILVASSGIGIHYGEELKKYLNQLEELKSSHPKRLQEGGNM